MRNGEEGNILQQHLVDGWDLHSALGRTRNPRSSYGWLGQGHVEMQDMSTVWKVSWIQKEIWNCCSSCDLTGWENHRITLSFYFLWICWFFLKDQTGFVQSNKMSSFLVQSKSGAASTETTTQKIIIQFLFLDPPIVLLTLSKFPFWEGNYFIYLFICLHYLLHSKSPQDLVA